MKTVIVDKISSVAIHQSLKRELRVSDEIPCEEGVLIAAEILNNKTSYNTLELSSGRMAKLKAGDVIIGALGHRKALFGYSGHLPETLVPGDTVQVLNMGGVLGICDSVNATFGPPFDARVLGAVLDFPYLGERIGVPARAGAEQLHHAPDADTHGVPVIAIAGTCMNAGKTAAACCDDQPAAPSRAHRRCLQSHRRRAAAGIRWPWKMPARATPRSSPTSA